jgi:hypothetical protein
MSELDEHRFGRALATYGLQVAIIVAVLALPIGLLVVSVQLYFQSASPTFWLTLIWCSGIAILAVVSCAIWVLRRAAPELRSKSQTGGQSPDDLIAIQDAARLVYEALEAAGVEDSIIQTKYSSPGVALDYFKYEFLARGVPLFGCRPPSRQQLRIDTREADLAPVSGASQLKQSHFPNKIAYEDVAIRRRDMNFVIEELKVQNARSRAMENPLNLEPTIRVDEVVKRITGRSRIPGPTEPGTQDLLDACENLREKGLRGSIAIFGGINWRTTLPADYDRVIRDRISPEYWRDHKIDVIDLMNDPRGRTSGLNGVCEADDFYGVWFDRRQIDLLWPPKRGGA